MIVSADANGIIDPPLENFLKGLNVNVPVVPLARTANYVFNERLYDLNEFVLIDYIEYGANDWDRKHTHIWGQNTELFEYRFKDNWEEWLKFDKFCKEHPPKITFKRELLSKDANETLFPCEYPCLLPSYPIQSKEEFNARKIDLIHFWGHSNESRRMFQSAAWEHAVKEDITICDNIYYLQGFINDNPKRLWAVMNIPHFARSPMEQVMPINGLSKLSLSLWGDGTKCFRSAEVAQNSIMVLPDDALAWSKEWIHGLNCIRIPMGEDMDSIRGINIGKSALTAIEDALRRTDLYEIYRNGIETNKHYMIDNYLNGYIKKNIEKAL